MKASLRFLIRLGWLVALLGPALAGCNFPSPEPEQTPTVPSEQTATLPAPPVTPTSALPSPPTATVPAAQSVAIYLIALEDNGRSGTQIGCGDSVVPVQVQIAPTRGVLRAALEQLLALDQPYYGQSGLYDALYPSDLRIDEVSVADGLATIRLSGSLRLGGVCDNPRVQAQLEQTALQFSTVNRTAILINERPLEEVLSEK